MKALKIFLTSLFVLTLGLGIQGCSSLTGSDGPSSGDDFYDDSFFEDLNFDINNEDGGYDASTESPGFGDPSFTSMFVEDEPANDPWENDPGVIAMGEDPGNVVAYARLIWGQLQHNPEITEITDWTGNIWVDSGAIVVKRLIRFESGTDWVDERQMETALGVVSQTTVHNDGLLLQIINDEPGLGDDICCMLSWASSSTAFLLIHWMGITSSSTWTSWAINFPSMPYRSWIARTVS